MLPSSPAFCTCICSGLACTQCTVLCVERGLQGVHTIPGAIYLNNLIHVKSNVPPLIIPQQPIRPNPPFSPHLLYETSTLYSPSTL